MVLGICAVAVRDEYETVAPTHPETQRTQEHAQVDQIGEGVSRCCAATRIGRRATRHSAHPRGEPRPCPCPTVSSTSQSGRTTTTHEWFESLGAAERGVDATRARLLVASRLTLVRSFAYVYARTRRLREHSVLECDKNQSTPSKALADGSILLIPERSCEFSRYLHHMGPHRRRDTLSIDICSFTCRSGQLTFPEPRLAGFLSDIIRWR